MFKTAPTRRCFGSTPGFAVCNALSEIPYLRAMPTSVSPDLTECVLPAPGTRGWPAEAGPGVDRTMRPVPVLVVAPTAPTGMDRGGGSCAAILVGG